MRWPNAPSRQLGEQEKETDMSGLGDRDHRSGNTFAPRKGRYPGVRKGDTMI